MRDRRAFHQDRGYDAVTTELHARQTIYDRLRFGVGLAVPFDTAAERNRTGRTEYRFDGQDQLIDTILIRCRTVTVIIMNRLTNA